MSKTDFTIVVLPNRREGLKEDRIANKTNIILRAMTDLTNEFRVNFLKLTHAT